MNIKLPKNEKLIIFVCVLLIIGLFAGVYFFVLYPKVQQIPLKETELSTQEQLLSTLQSKLTSTNANTFQNTVELQKMVPVKPLSQQLLLDIEKAEVVSGSFVVNMAFEDSEVTQEVAQQQEGESALTDKQEADLNGETVDEEKKETIPLPVGVKKITVTLSVESPSYFELEEFIRILENSERITVVETIDFTAGEEIIDYEQTDKPLSYQVKLSAFYMPTLSDLIDNLPKMETPEPANKKNPFSKFGDYTNSSSSTNSNGVNVGTDNSSNENTQKDSNATNDEQTAQSSNTSSTNDSGTEVKTSSTDTGDQKYTVQAGDHLTKISKRFYGDAYKDGINLIKEANSLKNDVLRVGQVLIIPPSP